MAFSHAKGSYFAIDDSTPSLQNISDSVQSVDFSQEIDNPEVTTFTKDDRVYIAGLVGATISISGFFDDSATTGADVVLDGLVGKAVSSTWEYGPEGNASGDIKYSGECFMNSYGISGSVDGVVEFTADFVITAAVSRATV